jgi:hypothetical protein
MSESGYPGLKDEQDENRDFITNYPLTLDFRLFIIQRKSLVRYNVRIGISRIKR